MLQACVVKTRKPLLSKIYTVCVCVCVYVSMYICAHTDFQKLISQI